MVIKDMGSPESDEVVIKGSIPSRCDEVGDAMSR